ncbi:MAG: hypothetical protein ACP5FH_10315, partial [Terracidiphilus sp.]
TYFNVDFASGGINVDFGDGFRSDGMGLAAIYWRMTGSDSFGISNGTITTETDPSGAAVLLDDSNCTANTSVHFTSRNVKVEINNSLDSGLGAFTLLDCPDSDGPEFYMDFENTWVAAGRAAAPGFNLTSLAMVPANDAALELSVLNGSFPSGTGANTSPRYLGLPALSRADLTGSGASIPVLSYAPQSASLGFPPPRSAQSASQFLGDVNIGGLWQDGVQASDLLFSDPAFQSLPKGTTLYPGQILAPPADWNRGNGLRFVLDPVRSLGTTGSLNGGETTCTGTAGTYVLTCTSAADLSPGQRISIGSDTDEAIEYVDATHPSAVLVHLSGRLGSTYSTPAALSFHAPSLAPEIQLLTKSSSAPKELSWSRGDVEENSEAAPGGSCFFVNVQAGTPGTWVSVPCGPLTAQTPRLGGRPLSPGCTNQPPIPVRGARTEMACVMSGGGGSQPANIQPQCFVSAPDTVTPQLCTAVATTPPAQSYNVRVF